MQARRTCLGDELLKIQRRRMGVCVYILLIVGGYLHANAHGETLQEDPCDAIFKQCVQAYQTGKWEESLNLFDRAAACFEMAGNKERYADCLHDMGNALHNLGQHEEALQHYEQALEIYQVLPNTEKYQLTCLSNMGLKLISLHRHEDALQRYEQILDILVHQPDTESDRVRCLLNISNLLDILRRYEEALERYVQVLEIFRNLPNTEKSQAICLNNMGNLLANLHRYEEALASYKLAMKIYQDLPNTQEDQADCLNNMGNALCGLRWHEKALEHFENALAILRDQPSTDYNQARYRNNMGNTLTELCRYEEALANYKLAMKIYQDLPNTQKDLADCLLSMGNTLNDLQRYEEALQRYEQALDIYRTQPNMDYNHAGCLLNMGNALKDGRQYEEALKYYKQALDIFRNLTNTEKDKAMCLFNMGNTLNNLWRYEESLTYYELAMEIFRNLPNSSERDQADCLQNMSNTLNDLQRYEEALQYYEQALDIYRTQPNTEMDQAGCLFNMGNTLHNVRRYDEALTRYEAAIDIYRTQPNTEKDQAGCLNNMGNALKDGRQYEEALKHYKQALDIFRNLTNTEKDQASCLNNIGSTILGLRRYDEALEHFKQAMEIYHALPNTEREQATCLFNMGNTLLHLSRYDEALERFEAALMIFQGLPNVDLEQGLCLQTMGFTYAAMGVWSQALDLIYQGFSGRWVWHLPALPTLSETHKKMFLDKQLDGSHPLYTVSLMQAGSLDLAAHHGLDVALMSKGLVEWAMQQEQSVFLEKATEDDDWKKAYEELQQWRREHAALAHTLTSSLHMQSELESPEARKGWEDRLRTLEERIAAREQDLARRNAPLAAEMRLTAVDTPAVSHALSTLGDNTCLLEYVKYREADFTSGTLEAARYGVYLLRSGSEAPVGIDLGPAQVIDEAIAAFRGAIDAMPSFLEKNRTYPKGVQSRQITAQYTEAGQTLRALIFDPVLPYVGTDTQLFVAPDAELFRLPFEALPSPVEAASGGRYLVEDYGFVYLNSGRELLRFVDRPLVGTSNNTAVIVSNPDVRMSDTERAAQLVRLLDAPPHGDREITLAQRPPNPEALLPGILGGAVLGSNTDVTLGVLLDGLDMISGADTFTEELFEFLEQSRRFDSVTVVQRKEALEECVQSLDGPRLLQILSHGVFLPMTERVADEDTLLMPGDASSHREIENPLLRSMLALAGASVSTSGDIYCLGERHFTEEEWLALDPSEREGDYTVIPLNDGRLTAYEVTGLDLYKTELVALTACSTALGDVGAGASVAGLRRAFTAAGAHSMIMAQWEVPVGPSMDQMKYFYEAWLGGGQGRYEAFRKSQLKVLADARKIKEVAGHPWFWAGFIYIGDPGAVRTE